MIAFVNGIWAWFRACGDWLLTTVGQHPGVAVVVLIACLAVLLISIDGR